MTPDLPLSLLALALAVGVTVQTVKVALTPPPWVVALLPLVVGPLLALLLPPEHRLDLHPVIAGLIAAALSTPLYVAVKDRLPDWVQGRAP